MAGARINQAVFGDPSAEPTQEILVVVFLRGGCDVINLIPPLAGDDRGHYETARSGEGLSIPTSSLLTLDSQFGLHPSAAHLHELFTDNKLAIIQAVGMNENTRSHFDAMEYMELGTPGSKSATDGWLTRHLRTTTHLPPNALIPSMATGNLSPTSFLSQPDVLAMSSPGNFNLNTAHWQWREAQRASLRSLYQAGDTAMNLAGLNALNSADIIEAQVSDSYTPPKGVVYPNNGFGDQLQVIAQMAKLQLGLRIATVDLGGWDTHENQSGGDPSTGYFADLVGTLSQGLHALYADLEISGYADRVTMVVQTEFGRRLRANANRGTDHGHGSAMLVLGGEVKGGLHGTWPGLHTDQLYDNADLAVTTDYRRILSEILIRRLGNPRLGVVFPDYTDYTPLDIVIGEDLPPDYTPDPINGTFNAYLPYITKP